MALWTFWLILASALLIAEVFTQSMTCLYVALGALAAMVCALMGYGWIPTTATCVAATFIIYILTYRTRRRILARLHADSHHGATGMEALIGRTATVTGDSDPRVRIDGDTWQVRPAKHAAPLHDGERVKVTGYDSIVLTVEPLQAE